MLDAQLINVFTLSVVNVFKEFSDIVPKKKNVYLIKEEKKIIGQGLVIKITGKISGDIIIDVNENLYKKIITQYKEKYPDIAENISEEDIKEIDQSIFTEIGNAIVSKISAYLYKLNKKSDISTPVVIPKGESIQYENIAIIEMSTPYGGFQLCLGLGKSELGRNVSLLLYGLNTEITEFLTTKFIPLGIEIISSTTKEGLVKYLKEKKIDLFIIDFYAIKVNPEIFLNSIISGLDYVVQIIFGVNKLEFQKLKTMKLATKTYQVIGIYPKTYSQEQLFEHIITYLKKIGISANEKRKHIRVNIPEKTRYFIAFKIGDQLKKARLIDLSVGGAKCLLDNEEDAKFIKVGLKLNSVDMFLKYQRLIIDCTIVNKSGASFGISFNNIIEQDLQTISKVIFKILSQQDF